MAKPAAQTVVDRPEVVRDAEEQRELHEAFRLDANHADNEDTCDRAERAVQAFLQEVEPQMRSRRRRWANARRLHDLESLSYRAEDNDIHLGLGHEIAESFAGKMEQSIFSTHGFLSGEPEASGEEEQAQASVDLVVHQLVTEAKFEQKALEWFRNAALYGVNIVKLTPELEVKDVIKRSVKSSALPDGGTAYEFSAPEEKEVASIKLRAATVHPGDFRVMETADGINEAHACGNFDYPTRDDIVRAVENGDYSSKKVNEFLAEYDKANGDLGKVKPSQGHNEAQRFVSGLNDRRGMANPDSPPHISQIARFECWMDFQIKGGKKSYPCVITMLLPAHEDQPILAGGFRGKVVRATRCPYYSGLKPYIYHPVQKLSGEFYSKSIMEIVAKHSVYEDDLALLGMTAAELECSPPREIGEAAGIGPEELDGHLPGKAFVTDAVGNVVFHQTPVRSGVAINMAEWLQGRAERASGFGRPESEPRSPSSGVVGGYQEMDSRLLTYIRSWEEYFAKEAAIRAHAYNQQYMTAERKVKTLGPEGVMAQDIRTVRPEDVMVEVRFNPMTSRQINQQMVLQQQFTNFLDRGIQLNMWGLQTGEGEYVDLRELLKLSLAGFGFKQYERIIKQPASAADFRSVDLEHDLFAMGENPGIQDAEKKQGKGLLAHAMGHSQFLMSGAADFWDPTAKQALVDHAWRTWEVVRAQLEMSFPTVGQMAQQLMGQMEGAGMAPTQGFGDTQSSQGQGGSRGISTSATQDQGSPIFRRPTPNGGIGGPNLGQV